MTEHVHDAAAPFLDAVARQLAHATGSSEAAVRVQVAALLRDVQDASALERRAAIAQRLVDQPVLLSVLFQNVDLLYEHEYPGADALSVAIMSALEILDRWETQG